MTFSGVSVVLRAIDYFAGYNFIVMALSVVLEAPEIAIFGLGYHFISRAFIIVNAPQERLGTPILSNVRSQLGRKGLSKAYRVLLKFNFLTVIPLGILIILLLGPAMSFLYPEDFIGAVAIAQIFTIQMIFTSTFTISRSALLVAERYIPIILSSSLYLITVPLIIITAKISSEQTIL